MKKVLSETPKIEIWQGDCLEKLKELEENSVDSVVTDPPYGIGFMNKEWDNPQKERELIEREKRRSEQRFKEGKSPTTAPFSQSIRPGLPIKGKKEGKWYQEWTEKWAIGCLRVLKPGGHLLSFGGTRTYHRMACAIEDAGFEVRDMINWVYGSGFPKSLNIGLNFDKDACRKELENELGRKPTKKEFDEKWKNFRKKTGGIKQHAQKGVAIAEERGVVGGGSFGEARIEELTEPKTKEAKQWEGWGTALKPAHEPICLCRKPIEKGLSIAENVLKWKTGGLNIDESRVGIEERTYGIKGGQNLNVISRENGNDDTNAKGCGAYGIGAKQITIGKKTVQGRFPANLIHDNSPEVRECFPDVKTGSIKPHKNAGSWKQSSDYITATFTGDSGSASRFFKSIIYTPKASKSERGKDNRHPCVKPTKLMEYLIKMITPKGGIVLDPFCGSGSTGMAAGKNGFSFVGIEKEEEYCRIAEARIKAALSQKKLF